MPRLAGLLHEVPQVVLAITILLAQPSRNVPSEIANFSNCVTVQGFFDVPVDNLYGRPLLKQYIRQHIPNYKDAVIISPDAGGAKRATAIADSMGVQFALIHKVISPHLPA
jgi:hypothetical protein